MTTPKTPHTTRNSPAWRWIGFVIALLGVGFHYWQLPYANVNLPSSLLGPGLVAVGVVAMLLRAFGAGRFARIWLLIGASVPLAVVIRVIADTMHDATSHNLWPFELAIAAGLGLAASLIGTAIGSLFLLRSSRRP